MDRGGTFWRTIFVVVPAWAGGTGGVQVVVGDGCWRVVDAGRDGTPEVVPDTDVRPSIRQRGRSAVRAVGDGGTQSRSASGFSTNRVIRESSPTRSVTSSLVSRATRSTPNSSTLNEASAVP
jgi:hypothetical protein